MSPPLCLFRVLLLHSSKAIAKEAAQVRACFGWPSPDPGLGPVIELAGDHFPRSLNLIGIGETLGSCGIAAKEAPPAFLEIEQSPAPLGMKMC